MNFKKSKWDYTFGWIDELVSRKLNPQKSDLRVLSEQQITDIRERFEEEISGAYKQLKPNSFIFLSDKKMRALTQRYQETLDYLRTCAQANFSAYADYPLLLETGDMILVHLDDLKKEFELRFASYLRPAGIKNLPVGTPRPGTKLMCNLSVDQIGIILKAADDTRLIISRSLSYIYRSLVPYLATEKIRKISWNSMRTSVYKIEPADKEQVIFALENMIKRIRGY